MSGEAYSKAHGLYSGDDLIGSYWELQSDLDAISKRLAGLGHTDAAKETEDTLLTLRQFVNRMTARIERLQPVWKALSWWDSCDSGEDVLTKALVKYRGGK